QTTLIQLRIDRPGAPVSFCSSFSWTAPPCGPSHSTGSAFRLVLCGCCFLASMATGTPHWCRLCPVVDHQRLRPHEAILEQVLQNAPSVVLGRMRDGIECKFRILRSLVGGV